MGGVWLGENEAKRSRCEWRGPRSRRWSTTVGQPGSGLGTCTDPNESGTSKSVGSQRRDAPSGLRAGDTPSWAWAWAQLAAPPTRTRSLVEGRTAVELTAADSRICRPTRSSARPHRSARFASCGARQLPVALSSPTRAHNYRAHQNRARSSSSPLPSTRVPIGWRVKHRLWVVALALVPLSDLPAVVRQSVVTSPAVAVVPIFRHEADGRRVVTREADRDEQTAAGHSARADVGGSQAAEASSSVSRKQAIAFSRGLGVGSDSTGELRGSAPRRDAGRSASRSRWAQK